MALAQVGLSLLKFSIDSTVRFLRALCNCRSVVCFAARLCLVEFASLEINFRTPINRVVKSDLFCNTSLPKVRASNCIQYIVAIDLPTEGPFRTDGVIARGVAL